jgi:hypothetical protein
MMRNEYFENGYVVHRGLLPADLIAELNQRFADVADGVCEPAENMQVVRNVEVAKGLVTPKTKAHGISKMNFVQADPVLRKYSAFAPLLNQVEQLIGPDLISMNSMYLNKPPHVDGRHPLHQDLIYFPFRPADSIVGVWSALEPITRENGCLVMIPGSTRITFSSALRTWTRAPGSTLRWRLVIRCSFTRILSMARASTRRKGYVEPLLSTSPTLAARTSGVATSIRSTSTALVTTIAWFAAKIRTTT